MVGIEDPARRESAAQALGLQASTDLVLVVAHPEYGREFREGVEALRSRLVVHSADGQELTIASAAHLTPARRRALAALPAGVAPTARTLGHLPPLWPVARRLASLGAPGRAATLEAHWPALLGQDLEAAVDAAAAEHLTGLDGLSEHARATVIATVEAYLDTGSVAAVGQRLFCHRNTVLKRLQRFHAVTGVDVTVPRAAALAVLLLDHDRRTRPTVGGAGD